MSSSKYNGSGRTIGVVERAVAEYLADKARHGGIFVKSTRIAEDLDLSSQRVAQAIVTLQEKSATLTIDRWTNENTSPATWHVEHDGPSPFGVECRDCGTLVDDVGDDCPSCGTEVSR